MQFLRIAGSFHHVGWVLLGIPLKDEVILRGGLGRMWGLTPYVDATCTCWDRLQRTVDTTGGSHVMKLASSRPHVLTSPHLANFALSS